MACLLYDLEYVSPKKHQTQGQEPGLFNYVRHLRTCTGFGSKGIVRRTSASGICHQEILQDPQVILPLDLLGIGGGRYI